jgi:hypothetical protein
MNIFVWTTNHDVSHFLLFNKFGKDKKCPHSAEPQIGPWPGCTGEADPRAVARWPAAWPGPQARPASEHDAGAHRARPLRGHHALALHSGAVTVGEPVP